jgi:DNA ligase D-like protein (predicted 3'-phosphoesterase)
MANKQDPLGSYRGKRDLERTPEPSAGRKRRSRARPRFVVHKHDATTLHYDFRLEAAGVLKSWAVPKGPSTNPKDKRLAMPTEDHPLDYFDFEGLIPEGQYGAGPVIVWDTGSYRSLTEEDGRPVPVERAVTDGHVAVWLEGRKLTGGYAPHPHREGQARTLAAGQDGRRAGRRQAQAGQDPAGVGALGANHRRGRRRDRSRRRLEGMRDPLAGLPEQARQRAVAAEQPSWTDPMLAILTDRRFSDPGWVFEPKFDGECCLAFRKSPQVRAGEVGLAGLEPAPSS